MWTIHPPPPDMDNIKWLLLICLLHLSFNQSQAEESPSAYFIPSMLKNAQRDINIFSNFDTPMENAVKRKKASIIFIDKLPFNILDMD